jgi:hypothetical protein
MSVEKIACAGALMLPRFRESGATSVSAETGAPKWDTIQNLAFQKPVTGGCRM